MKMIYANRDKLEMIANALLEYETLDGAQGGRHRAFGNIHTAAAPRPKVDPPVGCPRQRPRLPENCRPSPHRQNCQGSVRPRPAAAINPRGKIVQIQTLLRP